jgi:hypothetical protein
MANKLRWKVGVNKGVRQKRDKKGSAVCTEADSISHADREQQLIMDVSYN